MEVMNIILSPIASNKRTTIEVQGDTLIYDGVSYDLSAIPEGGEVEGEAPAIGVIKRVNGVIEITLQYFYDSLNCVYQERFPMNPYTVEGVLNV